MRRHMTRTAPLAASVCALALLTACGDSDEPSTSVTSTQTVSGPSSSTSLSQEEDKQLRKGAMSAFKKHWKFLNARPMSEPPSQAERKVMTDEAYRNVVEYTKTIPDMKVKGKDKLLSTRFVWVKWTSGGPKAAIAACYEVHRQAIAVEDGESWDKGDNLRRDQNGQKIEEGTKMVNLAILHRDRAEDAPWQVHSVEVGWKSSCKNSEGSSGGSSS